MAAVLDALVAGGLGLIVGAIVYVVIVLLGRSGHHAGDVVRQNAIFIGLPVGLIYAPLTMARPGERNGQTLGKQAMAIRVVRERHAPMDFPQGLLREAIGKQALAAVTFGIYILADYLWPLGDAQRQALHDKVAQTWVVRATFAPPVEQQREPDHLLAERGALRRPARRPPDPGPAPAPEEPLPGGWLPPKAD
jgi:uncharacterized RDD family membrane protein YckC